MPVQRCVLEGKPGFKWGQRSKCFTYAAGDSASRERARGRADRQGRAIQAARGGED